MTLFSVDTGELLPLVVIDCFYFQYEATVHVVQKITFIWSKYNLFFHFEKGKNQRIGKIITKIYNFHWSK